MKTPDSPKDFFKAALAEFIDDRDMSGANYIYKQAAASGLIDEPENPAEAFGVAALREAIMDNDLDLAKRIYKRLTELRA